MMQLPSRKGCSLMTSHNSCLKVPKILPLTSLGTGLFGKSTLRTVDLESGKIVSFYKMNNTYFGEGIAIYNETLYQLTWTNGYAFEYNLAFEIEKRYQKLFFFHDAP
jgi:hypothetical protein